MQCECGCGNSVMPDARGRIRRFINGHNSRRHLQCLGGKPAGEYAAYCNAKYRCTNPKNPAWKNYGGRGVRFLFDTFEQFFLELDHRPKGKTLERIDNNGHYEWGNVKWASRSEQQKNRRNLVSLMQKASAARWGN